MSPAAVVRDVSEGTCVLCGGTSLTSVSAACQPVGTQRGMLPVPFTCAGEPGLRPKSWLRAAATLGPRAAQAVAGVPPQGETGGCGGCCPLFRWVLGSTCRTVSHRPSVPLVLLCAAAPPVSGAQVQLALHVALVRAADHAPGPDTAHRQRRGWPCAPGPALGAGGRPPRAGRAGLGKTCLDPQLP